MKAEQLTDPVAFHAEGPVWWSGWGGLRYVDMLAGDVLHLAEDGSISRVHVGTVAAALRPRRGGGAVIGVERGFALQDADGTLRTLPEVWTDPSVRMNDGACDPQGRFYCGSMSYQEQPRRGSLYRLDPDGSTSVVFDGATISNGLDWSPDGATAYYVDSATHRVDAFDYDPVHGLTGRRPLAAVSTTVSPDGLTVDAEGHVWVALYDGSAVHRYRPDGKLDGVVELPVTKVTACTFGGPQLDRLYITTTRKGLPEGEQPAAGSVFWCRPGVLGKPALTFGG